MNEPATKQSLSIWCPYYGHSTGRPPFFFSEKNHENLLNWSAMTARKNSSKVTLCFSMAVEIREISYALQKSRLKIPFWSHWKSQWNILKPFKIPLRPYKIPLTPFKIPLRPYKIPLTPCKIPLTPCKIPWNAPSVHPETRCWVDLCEFASGRVDGLRAWTSRRARNLWCVCGDGLVVTGCHQFGIFPEILGC